ncbi:type I methionyl aminopeptidase [Fictibacillus phosphorivorans]|uniref:type I methionyl aminopeptidase n=1 Tax=Fictibacillus phosphorivorans TaxID=1221500 RepID=UPI00203E7C31|nr:type I methionyl aminopeptidase [Fictibacillus phosphorivorans]MCM3718647.1 type I methionyl aminopeptidase [Fictibacillus phosphorivorans]MCM3776270.1 type I methionyl aminopeptidase [Fictibacillus phosphorivorans]
MVEIKSDKQIEKMKRAGAILAECHKALSKKIQPGITSAELDQFVEDFLHERGAKPAQKGYMGYPFATCASVNNEVCHGLPNRKPLKNGDILTVDFVVDLDGWLADSAWSYGVGTITPESQRLMKATKKALYKGIEQAQPGNRLGDIGYAIESYAYQKGYSIVREYIGHGIGRRIHEEPEVHHVGERNSGMKLKEGMVITIEPIFTQGLPFIAMGSDGWTALTFDGSLSAQYEHTVAITREGPIILTEQA